MNKLSGDNKLGKFVLLKLSTTDYMDVFDLYVWEDHKERHGANSSWIELARSNKRRELEALVKIAKASES